MVAKKALPVSPSTLFTAFLTIPVVAIPITSNSPITTWSCVPRFPLNVEMKSPRVIFPLLLVTFPISKYLDNIKLSFLIGNMRRREDIRKFWFFDCKCKRCADPTELNSYMSAVTCFACKRGFLLPISALEYKSDWQCDHCRNVVPYDLVNEVISTIEAQVFQMYFLF